MISLFVSDQQRSLSSLAHARLSTFVTIKDNDESTQVSRNRTPSRRQFDRVQINSANRRLLNYTPEVDARFVQRRAQLQQKALAGPQRVHDVPSRTKASRAPF